MTKTSAPPINISFDLDGFASTIEMRDWRAFRTDIEISFNVSAKSNAIHTKKYYRTIMDGTLYDVSSLDSLKIGTIQSVFGIISVFVVDGKAREKDGESEFANKISNILSKHGNVTLVGAKNAQLDLKKFKLRNEDICKVFKRIMSVSDAAFIMVEHYGAKAKFSKTEITDPVSQLDQVIDLACLRAMKCDIACQIDHGSNNATFLGSNVFEKLGLNANYNPLFSHRVQNANMYTQEMKDNTIIYRLCDISKVNFYSQLEDSISDARRTTFFSRLAYQHMKVDLYGYSSSKSEAKTAEKMTSRYENMFKGISTDEPLPYRLEVRVSLPLIFDALQYISYLLSNASYWLVKTCELAKIIRLNIDHILEKFQHGTVENIYDNMLLETVLTEWYLKGSKNLHLISKIHKKQIKQLYSSDCIPILDVRPMIMSNADIGIVDKVRTVRKLIQSNLNSCQYEKNLYNSFMNVFEHDSPSAAVSLILDVYVLELTKFHNLSGILFLNYEQCKQMGHEVSIDLKVGPKNIKTHIRNTFFARASKIFAFQALTQLIGEVFTVKPKEVCELIATHYNTSYVNLAFKLYTSRNNSCCLIRLTKKESRNDASTTAKLLSSLKCERVNVNRSSKRQERWSNIELACLVSGIMRYDSQINKYNAIFTDFAYTFYLTRTAKNAIHDRFRCLLSSKESLILAIKEAVTFLPSHITVEDHFEIYERFEVELNVERKTTVEQLVADAHYKFRQINFAAVQSFFISHKTCLSQEEADCLVKECGVILEQLPVDYFTCYADKKWDLEDLCLQSMRAQQTVVELSGMGEYLELVADNILICDNLASSEPSNNSLVLDICDKYEDQNPFCLLNTPSSLSEYVNSSQSPDERQNGTCSSTLSPCEHDWLKKVIKKCSAIRTIQPHELRKVLFNAKNRPCTSAWEIFINKCFKLQIFLPINQSTDNFATMWVGCLFNMDFE